MAASHFTFPEELNVMTYGLSFFRLRGSRLEFSVAAIHDGPQFGAQRLGQSSRRRNISLGIGFSFLLLGFSHHLSFPFPPPATPFPLWLLTHRAGSARYNKSLCDSYLLRVGKDCLSNLNKAITVAAFLLQFFAKLKCDGQAFPIQRCDSRKLW